MRCDPAFDGGRYPDVQPYADKHRRWARLDRRCGWLSLGGGLVQLGLVLVAYSGRTALELGHLAGSSWGVLGLAASSIVVGRIRTHAHDQLIAKWGEAMARDAADELAYEVSRLS